MCVSPVTVLWPSLKLSHHWLIWNSRKKQKHYSPKAAVLYKNHKIGHLNKQIKSSSLSDYSNHRNCPRLSADISSFLRSQFFQPISLHFVKVTLDSRLQGFILPDGCQAEGGTCELTWHYHLCDITLQSSGERQLTPIVKTSGLIRRPGELGGTWCSNWGVVVSRWGVVASEGCGRLRLKSSSTFLDSGFL